MVIRCVVTLLRIEFSIKTFAPLDWGTHFRRGFQRLNIYQPRFIEIHLYRAKHIHVRAYTYVLL